MESIELLDESQISNWPTALAPEAFHGPLGDLVLRLKPETEADPAALLIQALVLFGNLLGHAIHFTVGGTKHALILFVALVGITSKGRKGSSLDLIMQTFTQLDPCLSTARRVKSGLSSGEGLIWQMRDPIGDDPGVSDKRLVIQEPELARVLRNFQRDGNTLSPVLRQSWDSGRLSILTKGNAAVATEAHVSLIGHITKDELTRYLDATEIGSGFANRFLWVCVKRARVLPEGGRLVDVADIVQQLRLAVEFADCLNDAVPINRDDHARRLWADVYPKLSEGRDGLWGAVTSRAEAQVARLACLYAVADLSSFVTPEHLRAALAVWKYCDESASYIFGKSFGDATADTINKALIAAGPDGMSRTDISKLFSRNKDTKELTTALTKLHQLGCARQTEHKGQGRPAEVWVATKDTN